MARPASTLSLITPVLPGRDRYLAETAASVRAERDDLADNWELEWVLVIDGPGEVAIPDGVSRVIELPLHSGIAAARNIGLVHAAGEWIYPLDGDDLLNPGGLRAVLGQAISRRYCWIASNRLRIDGSRTPHWHERPHDWPHGALPDYWESPFLFHPGSVLVRRESALAIGGWPALPSNEGMAFILGLGAKYSGRFRPEVITLERDWEGQANRDSVYAQAKEISFGAIAALLGARHGGRIQPPTGCLDAAHMQEDPDT